MSLLPKGVTCSDCAYWKRCSWLIGLNGEETECDWEPSRFKPKAIESTASPSEVVAE